jgi:hypothetical protein
MTKKEANALDRTIAQYFKKHGCGAEIPVFDLAKITRAGRLAHAEGRDIEQAVKVAIQIYRAN